MTQRVPIFLDLFADGVQDLPVLSGNGSVSETGGALVVSATVGTNVDWWTFGRLGKLPYVGVDASNYGKVYYEFTIRSWTTTNPSYSHLVVGLCQSDTVMWWLYTQDGTNFAVQKNWGGGNYGTIATALPRKFRFIWDRMVGTVTVQCQTGTSPVVWTDIVSDQSIGMTPVRLGLGIKNWTYLPACSVEYEGVEIYAENFPEVDDPEGFEDNLAMPQQGLVGLKSILESPASGTAGIVQVTGDLTQTGQGEGFEDALAMPQQGLIGLKSIFGSPASGTAGIVQVTGDLTQTGQGEGFEDTCTIRPSLVPPYSPWSNDPEGHPYFLDTLGSPRLRGAFLYDAANDPWNDPATYALNGYARDGYRYINGVKKETYWEDLFENGVVDLSTDIPVGTITESGGRLNFSIGSGVDAQWWSSYYKAPLAYYTYTSIPGGTGRFSVTTRLSAMAGPNLKTAFLLCLMGSSYRANAYRFEVSADSASNWVLGGNKVVSGTASGLTLSPGGTIPNPNTTPSLLKISWDTSGVIEFWHSPNDGNSWTRHYVGTLEFTPSVVGVALDNWSPFPASSASCDYLRISYERAPWATEPAGTNRSSRPDFPVKSLLVTSQSELAVFDLDDWPTSLKLWMRFRLGDASNFYLLGRIADSLRQTRMLNGTLMVGSVHNGTENGGLFCVDFKRTGTDFLLLVRSDGWWNGTSGRNITHRNQTGNFVSQGTGFTLDSEYVHFIDAALDTSVANREKMWVAAGSEDLVRIVEIVANQPKFDYDPVGSLVGPYNDYAAGLRCYFFDSAGWLWIGWGPYVFRAIRDFQGGVIVMGANAGSPAARHPYVQLVHHQKSVIVRGMTQVNESIYACTNVGIYRINRFTLDAYLCYTISGGLGGGRLNSPPAGELLGGEKEWVHRAVGFVVNRSGRPIGYLAVANSQTIFDPTYTSETGRGAVTIIRTYDDTLIDRRLYTGLSFGLDEDGAFFLTPFGK